MAVCRLSLIPFEMARQFRAQVVSDEGLVADAWDPYSEQMGFFRDEELLATFRLVRPDAGRLPVSEHVPGLSVDERDRQVGRFATKGLEHWDFRSGEIFYDDYRARIITQGRRLYVAVPAEGPAVIPLRRYVALRFHDTGHRYYDKRYAREFRILMRENEPIPDAVSTAPETAHDPSGG